MKTRQLWISAIVVLLLAAPGVLQAQTPLDTAFTYQGELKQAGAPVNGLADFDFTLWGAESGGSQVGWAVLVREVDVVDGLFTVQLGVDQRQQLGGSPGVARAGGPEHLCHRSCRLVCHPWFSDFF